MSTVRVWQEIGHQVVKCQFGKEHFIPEFIWKDLTDSGQTRQWTDGYSGKWLTIPILQDRQGNLYDEIPTIDFYGPIVYIRRGLKPDDPARRWTSRKPTAPWLNPITGKLTV